jgi:uncharacterized protein
MDPITYSITNSNNSSTTFKNDLSRLADEVVSRASTQLDVASKYSSYQRGASIEQPRSHEEYLFDVICLGTFWSVYGNRALQTPVMPLHILRSLYTLRNRFRSIKSSVDNLRGRLGSLWLTQAVSQDEHQVELPSLKDIKQLILWLKATGEFPEESKRLLLLLEYLTSLKASEYFDTVSSIIGFAAWFEKRSLAELGVYTPNVERFKETRLPMYRGREDAVFVGRARVEYHLSMLGAELMNRAFRPDFHATSKRSLLVPACMRRDPDKCIAKQIELDMLCSQCDRDCAVNKLTEQGQDSGFDVHIIPHSSDFTDWLSTWAAGSGIGVIGVACPLNIIRGGLELKSLDIPAQCMLLNECGCKGHWDDEGIPTSLDEKELLSIMKNGQGYIPLHQD